jgi:hypothetical protein
MSYFDSALNLLSQNIQGIVDTSAAVTLFEGVRKKVKTTWLGSKFLYGFDEYDGHSSDLSVAAKEAVKNESVIKLFEGFNFSDKDAVVNMIYASEASRAAVQFQKEELAAFEYTAVKEGAKVVIGGAANYATSAVIAAFVDVGALEFAGVQFAGFAISGVELAGVATTALGAAPAVVGYIAMNAAFKFLEKRRLKHENSNDAIPGVAFVSLGIDPWLAALIDDAIEAEVLKAVEAQVLKKPSKTFVFLSRLRTPFTIEFPDGTQQQGTTYVASANEITDAFKDGNIQETVQKFQNKMNDQSKQKISNRDPTLDSLRTTFNAAFERTQHGWVSTEPPTHYELFVKQHMQVESKDGTIGLETFKMHFHAWVKHMLRVVIEAHTYNMPVKRRGDSKAYKAVEDMEDEAERLAYVKSYVRSTFADGHGN